MTNSTYKTKNSSFAKMVRSRTEHKTSFEYLSGICGSGKTETLINYATQASTQEEKKIIFASPSIELCGEIGSRIQAKGYSPKVIHSKNLGSDTSVSHSIIETMSSLNPDQGQILVVTHQALYNLPYYPNNAPKSEWTVIHDEAIDPTCYIELRLKNHQHYIDAVISIPKNKWHLPFVPAVLKGDMNLAQQRAIIKNKHNDQFYEQLINFYQHAENARAGKCDIIVDTAAYRSFMEGDGQKFIATVVYNPSVFHGFERVIFSGAMFDYELLFNLWRDFYGVDWVKSHLMPEEIGKHHSPLKVVSVFPNLNWSKNLGNKSFENKTVLETIDTLAQEYFDSKDVVWTGNKDHEKPDSQWVECPYASRGVNKFREYTSMYYSPAYNHSAPYYKFMEWAGCKEIVKLSQNVAHCYQQVSRLKLRDNGTSECVLFVPCRSIIDPISGYFENIVFETLEGEVATRLRETVGDKRTEKEVVYAKASGDTRSENAVAVSRNKALKKLKASLVAGQFSTNLLNSKKIQTTKTVVSLCNDSGNTTAKVYPIYKGYTLAIQDDLASILEQSPFMFFENIYSSSGYGMDESPGELAREQQDFIFHQLHLFHRRVAKSKSHNLLCGAFIQDPKNPGRKKENIQSLFGQFMDFDTTRWMFVSKEFPMNIEGVKSEGNTHYINDPALKEILSRGTEWTLDCTTENGIEKRTIAVSSPLVFETLMPITISDIQEVIGVDTRVLLHSTFSGGNKRRAFILYDRLVSPDEHEMIARDIFHKIMKKHPHSQMDWTCTRSNSLFYLPASSVSQDNFIEESGTESFDVDEWLSWTMAAQDIQGPEVTEEPVSIVTAPERDESITYEQKVRPLISQMTQGNRFIPAQKAVSTCKKHCPGMKMILESDLDRGGLDKNRLKSMMGWFERL